MLCEPRFVTGRRVLVNNTLIHRFVNDRDSSAEQLAARGFVVAGDRRAKLFDLGAKSAAIAAVDRVSLSVLSDTLYSGFMICHCLMILRRDLSQSETMSIESPEGNVKPKERR